MRHKHYDCIVAWAAGANIECRHVGTDEWHEAFEPTWSTNYEYRIKKEPVIEVKYFKKDHCGDYLLAPYGYKGIWHLKITYQDGKAIKAEVAE